ncbi:unnamed protein product [Lampetra fluviatilis]
MASLRPPRVASLLLVSSLFLVVLLVHLADSTTSTSSHSRALRPPRRTCRASASKVDSPRRQRSYWRDAVKKLKGMTPSPCHVAAVDNAVTINPAGCSKDPSQMLSRAT